MGYEAEVEPSSTPKLRLLNIPPIQSPEWSGMLTPPLHTSASVPFRWEEEPGKPRPCTALITTTITTTSDPSNLQPKSLELPPRLQQQLMESKMTKMPSPTTVLDGPYVGTVPVFQSSSFRFERERERQRSFGSSVGSPESGQLLGATNERGFFGSSWGRRRPTLGRGKKEVCGGSMVFSRSMDCISDFGSADESGGGRTRVRMPRVRMKGSFSRLSRANSHFWATICEGFKQVVPWRCNTQKKQRLII